MDGKPIPQARDKGHLSPLEMEQLKSALQVGETMRALTAYGDQLPPASPHLALPPLWARRPGEPKSLENGSRKVSSLLSVTDATW